MWKRSSLISVANPHKTLWLNIFLLENRNLWLPSKRSTRKRDFPQPMLIILSYRLHYSLHGGANVWLGLFRVLSDRVLLRVLRDRVLFRVLNDRVLFRALSDRVLFRLLSNRVLFRVLLRVLSDSVLFQILSPLFLVCRVCHQLNQ